MALLDREVKYLVNKAKIWKPKPETTNHMENKTDQAINATQLPDVEPTSVPDVDIQSEKSNKEEVTEDTLSLPKNDDTKTNNERDQQEKHQEL